MESDWLMVGDVEDTVKEAISTPPGLRAMSEATIINASTHVAIGHHQFPSLYLTAYVGRWIGETAEAFNKQPVLNRATVLLLWDAFQKPTPKL